MDVPSFIGLVSKTPKPEVEEIKDALLKVTAIMSESELCQFFCECFHILDDDTKPMVREAVKLDQAFYDRVVTAVETISEMAADAQAFT